MGPLSKELPRKDIEGHGCSPTGQEEEQDGGDTGLIHRARQPGLQKPNPKLGVDGRS